MARLYDNDAICPHCGTKRDMHLTHRITGSENFLDKTLAEIDLPELGIVRASSGKERVYLEFTGDTETFLQFS
jgi:adenylyltransferase/sulfurtransferase